MLFLLKGESSRAQNMGKCLSDIFLAEECVSRTTTDTQVLPPGLVKRGEERSCQESCGAKQYHKMSQHSSYVDAGKTNLITVTESSSSGPSSLNVRRATKCMGELSSETVPYWFYWTSGQYCLHTRVCCIGFALQ